MLKFNYVLTIASIVAMVFSVTMIDGPWYMLAIVGMATGLTNILLRSLD